MMHKNNHRSGFLFIEVMVVTLLCSVLMMYGIMQFSFFDSIIIHAELSKLTAVCLYLQRLASATNQEQYLAFDSIHNNYQYDNHTVPLTSMLCFGLLTGVKGPPGSASKVVERPITFLGNRICFYPTGIISSGTVYMIDKHKKFQYALSNSVSQVSYLRLYHYDGQWKIVHHSY
jgi:hypothetical protein